MTGGSKLFPDYLAGGCFLSDTMTSLLTFYHSINVKKVSRFKLELRKPKKKNCIQLINHQPNILSDGKFPDTV